MSPRYDWFFFLLPPMLALLIGILVSGTNFADRDWTFWDQDVTSSDLLIGIFVTIFGVSYLRFLFHLPRRVAVHMAAAGAIYVLGALVMELPLGYWTDLQGEHNLTYGLIDLVEESLEIIGVSFFLYTLLGYLAMITAPMADAAVSLIEPGAPEKLEWLVWTSR